MIASITCAIYIRKSREDKDKPSHRLTVQREQLPAHAASQGWAYSVYDDGHASAARGKVDSLKERSRLEADIRAGKIGIILTIELSRLSRDDSLQDYVAWLHLCAEHRVKLATMSRTLDPSQHSDWMLLLMEGGFSSVEMRVLQSRMAEGRAQALQTGKFLGGQLPPPYIYGRAKNAPVVDPEALERMRQLWHLAETKSTRQVAEELKVPLITIRRAISDQRLLFCQAKRPGPTGTLIDCEWEPCLTEEQAERIRANRSGRLSSGSRRIYGGLLSNLGLFQCGYCGRSIRAWTNSRRRKDGSRLDYYGCKANELKRTCPDSRMISQEAINERVITNVLGTLSDTAMLRESWLASQKQDGQEEQLTDLERQGRKLQEKKQRLVAAVVEGVLNFTDAKAQREELDAAIAATEQARQSILRCQREEPDWEALALMRDQFGDLEEAERRQMITLVVKNIRMFASYLIIEYLLPRGPAGEMTSRVHLPPPAKTGPKVYKDKT